MEQLIPIPTLHLFPVLDELLIELLCSLSPADWQKPTLAKLWTVKDVAAHLLDGNIRGISLLHNYEPPFTAQINSYQDLVGYLNQLNAVWVNAMKRVSPQSLIAQLQFTGPQYIEYLNTLDPFATAKYAVAWAGEEQSFNWFHIAREYTEKWHHQQQIREAVGQTGDLMKDDLFYPCIATFMCALPHAYKNTVAEEKTTINFTIGDHNWFILKTCGSWNLTAGFLADDATAHISMHPDVAWKLFTKAITPALAHSQSTITGDIAMAEGIFNMVAVIA